MIPASRTFSIKAEAAGFLAAVRADRDRGTWVDPPAGTVAFEAYARSWLETRELRPRTVDLYEGLLRLHILPTLGSLRWRRSRPQRFVAGTPAGSLQAWAARRSQRRTGC